MTNPNLSINDLKVMWVVGAAERLGTLGIFNSDVPLRISSEHIDTFIKIHEMRNIIFENDNEVATIFEVMARTESSEIISEENMKTMIKMILEYKNNPNRIVKKSLEMVYEK